MDPPGSSLLGPASFQMGSRRPLTRTAPGTEGGSGGWFALALEMTRPTIGPGVPDPGIVLSLHFGAAALPKQ
jgi:hypothetical protein